MIEFMIITLIWTVVKLSLTCTDFVIKYMNNQNLGRYVFAGIINLLKILGTFCTTKSH